VGGESSGEDSQAAEAELSALEAMGGVVLLMLDVVDMMPVEAGAEVRM
jgi:hypothetical protein